VPVTVDVPVRILVDPPALTSLLDDLGEAVAAATGRAMADCVAVIAETRGGYAAHRTHDPVVTWTGAALPQVPQEVRDQCEQVIRDAIAGAVAEALAGVPAGQTEPLNDDPAEIVDATRIAPLAGLYRLPSYQDGADTVIAFEAEQVIGRAVLPRAWARVSSDKTRDRYVDEAIERYGGEPASGQLGIIFRNERGFFGIGVWQFPSNEPLLPQDLLGLKKIEFVREGNQVRVELRPLNDLPAGATYRVRYVGPAQTKSDRREAMRSHIGDLLRPKLLEEAGRTGGPLMAEKDLTDQVEARLEELLDHLAETTESAACLIELSYLSARLLILSDIDVPDLDSELLPLVVEMAPVRPDRTAPGAGEGGQVGGKGGEGAGGKADGGTGGKGDEQGEGPEGDFGILPGEGEQSVGGRLFPSSAYGGGGEYDCSPLNGELPLDQLGDLGTYLGRLIDEIARDLQLPVCAHAARFCVNAAEAVAGRAAAVAEQAVGVASFTRAYEAKSDPAVIRFVPNASPAILFLRHLAGVVPKLTELSRAIQEGYSDPAVFSRMGGPWNESTASWRLHFLMEYTPAIAYSTGRLFVYGCQVLLLQMLRTSREAIQQRIAALPTYLPVLERLILGFVMKVEDLDILFDRLSEAADDSLLRAGGRAAYGTWQEAKSGLADILAGRDPLATAATDRGELVYKDGKAVAIRDRFGKLWTLDQLREAVSLRRGTAVSLDPLVAQIVDDDEVLDRFRRDPGSIGAEIITLLFEMRSRNAEITDEVRGSTEKAFRFGKIQEQLAERTIPGTTYALSGIHLATHEQIGEFFRGDPMYAEGVDRLFSAELGRQSLNAFFEFTGMTLLAIMCAPAAIIAGAALAAYHYTEALEREHLFRSLINPEEVITRAEVEMDLFMAEFELALSFIPEAGTLLRGGARVAKTIGRQGLVAGTRSLTRTARRQLTVAVARQLRSATLAHVLKEIVEDQIEDQLLETLVFAPIAASIQAEFGQGAAPDRTLRTIRRSGAGESGGAR
jgi:hypothetical protein